MAAGRVMTGFSLPYVALYTANGGTDNNGYQTNCSRKRSEESSVGSKTLKNYYNCGKDSAHNHIFS